MMEKSRRSLLVTAVVGVPLSGCGMPGESENDQPEGHEVVAINDTEVRRTLSVQIEDENGRTVFRHEYNLEPGHADQSQSVETDLDDGVITLSEPEFGTVEEPFLPLTDSRNPHSDVPPDACKRMDIVVGVDDSGLYVTYGCQ